MTTDVQMPTRRWGDEDDAPAPVPVVVISSRDGAPVPVVAGALRLVRAAEAAGWTATQTYAVAEVPTMHYQNGNVKAQARRLETVAVRLRRVGDFAGFAVWARADDGRWAFSAAQLGLVRYGLRDLTAALAVTR